MQSSWKSAVEIKNTCQEFKNTSKFRFSSKTENPSCVQVKVKELTQVKVKDIIKVKVKVKDTSKVQAGAASTIESKVGA